MISTGRVISTSRPRSCSRTLARRGQSARSGEKLRQKQQQLILNLIGPRSHVAQRLVAAVATHTALFRRQRERHLLERAGRVTGAVRRARAATTRHRHRCVVRVAGAGDARHCRRAARVGARAAHDVCQVELNRGGQAFPATISGTQVCLNDVAIHRPVRSAVKERAQRGPPITNNAANSVHRKKGKR